MTFDIKDWLRCKRLSRRCIPPTICTKMKRIRRDYTYVWDWPSGFPVVNAMLCLICRSVYWELHWVSQQRASVRKFDFSIHVRFGNHSLFCNLFVLQCIAFVFLPCVYEWWTCASVWISGGYACLLDETVDLCKLMCSEADSASKCPCELKSV